MKHVVNRITSNHPSIGPIVPTKRRFEDAFDNNGLCIKCIPNVGLENLFAASPYSKILVQRHYVPLADDVCALLNKDWDFYPQVKYFSAMVLAGAILLNTNNKQAVMVNTVEMYGRTKTVDRHRETFGKLKNGTHTTSLPPPIKIPHPDVWPTLYEKRDGQKLVIGTQVSNALVTSSIRLDEKHDPSVGGTTVHFQLSTIKDSLACKIFLDTESMNAGLAMINDPSASSVSDTGMLVHQLRQIRTRFDSPTTYNLCRASGPLTKVHACQPYSLFTLIEADRARNPCAKVFRLVAMQVLQQGNNAKLAKADVTEITSQATGKCKEMMTGILDLFDDETDALPILYNAHLNTELEGLAELLIPSIVSANEAVGRQVTQVFEFLN